jgi:hypothetical protein
MHEFKGVVDAYSAALAATRAECGYIIDYVIMFAHSCSFLLGRALGPVRVPSKVPSMQSLVGGGKLSCVPPFRGQGILSGRRPLSLRSPFCAFLFVIFSAGGSPAICATLVCM